MDVTVITVTRAGDGEELEVCASGNGLSACETVIPARSLAKPSEIVWKIGDGVYRNLDDALSQAKRRAEDALALKTAAREEVDRYFKE